VGDRDAAPDVTDPLRRLMTGVDAAAAAWSGSPVGYHARVYYEGFSKVPPGARWSKEWGFHPALSNEGVGDWREYIAEDVVHFIRERADNPDLAPLEQESGEARATLQRAQGEIDSILAVFESRQSDELVHQLRAQAAGARALTQQQAAQAYVPQQIMTRDAQALGEGFIVAPHLAVHAKVVGLKAPFAACGQLADIAERAAKHIARLARSATKTASPTHADRVFIGHGRSLLWLELKDFLHDRLGLQHEEFNRVSPAGIAISVRLQEMLDHAVFAFLILTAEDEQDGKEVARQNVVHEVGLFQARLGSGRAIVMLEEGCEEFSNIRGLGQIRFPKGNIKASFEEVREVLEREGVVEPKLAYIGD
jgi:predicted nucleotide-binding protein